MTEIQKKNNFPTESHYKEVQVEIKYCWESFNCFIAVTSLDRINDNINKQFVWRFPWKHENDRDFLFLSNIAELSNNDLEEFNVRTCVNIKDWPSTIAVAYMMMKTPQSSLFICRDNRWNKSEFLRFTYNIHAILLIFILFTAKINMHNYD